MFKYQPQIYDSASGRWRGLILLKDQWSTLDNAYTGICFALRHYDLARILRSDGRVVEQWSRSRPDFKLDLIKAD